MNIYNLKNRIANNYLVGLNEGGYVLIDTGYVEGYANFLKRLEKTGVSPKDIRYVFLTHAHDDHAGFLNDVLAITDAKVILHPKAIERLLKGQNPFIGGCSSRLAWLFCQILKLFGKGEHKYPTIKQEYLNRLCTQSKDDLPVSWEAVSNNRLGEIQRPFGRHTALSAVTKTNRNSGKGLGCGFFV